MPCWACRPPSKPAQQAPKRFVLATVFVSCCIWGRGVSDIGNGAGLTGSVSADAAKCVLADTCSGPDVPVARSIGGSHEAPAVPTSASVLLQIAPREMASKTAVLDSTGCLALWSKSMPDMVGDGLSWRMFELAFIRAWTHDSACMLAVSAELAKSWQGWELAVIWDAILTDDKWAQQMDMDGLLLTTAPIKLQNYPASGVPDLTTRLKWMWTSMACSSDLEEFMIRVFSPFLKIHGEPYPGESAYIGLHVRQGDKIIESPVYSFNESMKMVRRLWKDLHPVFVATHDANLIEGKEIYEAEGYRFELGGKTRTRSSESSVGHHLHDFPATSAALGDLAGLAYASTLVGNWNSGFFRLAWLLNGALHRNTQRKKPWCFDLASNLSCDCRRDFVEAACNKTGDKGIKRDIAPIWGPACQTKWISKDCDGVVMRGCW